MSAIHLLVRRLGGMAISTPTRVNSNLAVRSHTQTRASVSGPPNAVPGAAPFTTSAATTFRATQAPQARKGRQPRDPKAVHIHRKQPKKRPAPLRMSRQRWLRHWTIHRAWKLWERKERERQERSLMRQWQSMYAACEELRNTLGPEDSEPGRLFEMAMDKTGVFSTPNATLSIGKATLKRGQEEPWKAKGAIPIEYSRAQTETPARVAWDHDWRP